MRKHQAFITEPARQVPLTEDRDVIVAGGGVSGVMAAIAAAREGADVLVLERGASLGGVAAMGLPLQGFVGSNNDQIVLGLAEELRQRLIQCGGAVDHFTPCDMHNPFQIVDPERVKLVTQQMLKEAGASVRFHSFVSDALMDGHKIDAIFTEGKSGREACRAKLYVDCTGDADLAARAGAPYEIADAQLLQANTLNFTLSNVDTEAIKKYLKKDGTLYSLFPMLNERQLLASDHFIMVGMQDLVERSKAEFPDADLWGNVCYITLVTPGTVCINSVHVHGYCPCESKDLSEIERIGRERAHQVYAFYKKYVPGFENAVLSSTAPWAGIRETRIIRGMSTLTLDAVRRGNIPSDSIALGGYPVDVHKPDTNGLIFYKVPAYGIPYGCLIPKDVDNLLVSGRAISADREAMASSRVMAQCMAVGEASGIAAALCARQGVSPASLDVQQLRDALTSHNARIR